MHARELCGTGFAETRCAVRSPSLGGPPFPKPAIADNIDNDMEQRFLGNSGLSVSALSFGTMTIGGRDRFAKMGNLGVDDTIRILDVLRDAGVTTLDTADVYSFGGAEEVLGQALKGRRDEFVLVSKAYQRDVPRSVRHRAVAQVSDRGVRGEPAPAADRLPRSLPLPRARHARAGRGNAARLRRSGHVGQGPLHRLLEPRGVAGDEGAGGVGPHRRAALHHASRSTTRSSRATSSTTSCRWPRTRRSG